MKHLIICTLLLFLSIRSIAQVRLLEETPIKVKIISELSSKTAQVGDIVYFKIAESLRIDSITVIDTTSQVIGEVIEAQKARSLGRPGKLDFTINTVKSVDGQNIKLRATAKKITGKDKTGGVIAAAVIFTPVLLFIKGKEVIIEVKREFIVFVDKEYIIKNQ